MVGEARRDNSRPPHLFKSSLVALSMRPLLRKPNLTTRRRIIIPPEWYTDHVLHEPIAGAFKCSCLQPVLSNPRCPFAAVTLHPRLRAENLARCLWPDALQPKVSAHFWPDMLPRGGRTVHNVESATTRLLWKQTRVNMETREDVLASVRVQRSPRLLAAWEGHRAAFALNVSIQAQEQPERLRDVHGVVLRDKPYDGVWSDLAEGEAFALRGALHDVVLLVVEYVLGMWVWNARERFREGRVIVDLVCELDAVRLACNVSWRSTAPAFSS